MAKNLYYISFTLLGTRSQGPYPQQTGTLSDSSTKREIQTRSHMKAAAVLYHSKGQEHTPRSTEYLFKTSNTARQLAIYVLSSFAAISLSLLLITYFCRPLMHLLLAFDCQKHN